MPVNDNNSNELTWHHIPTLMALYNTHIHAQTDIHTHAHTHAHTHSIMLAVK